jgi:hypothetical protein
MPRKRFRPVETIGKLRYTDVVLGQGTMVTEVVGTLEGPRLNRAAPRVWSTRNASPFRLLMPASG